MSQARPMAWWRQARNDLDLAVVASRYPLEDMPPMDLFESSDSEQAISTATAVLTWFERLDQGEG